MAPPPDAPDDLADPSSEPPEAVRWQAELERLVAAPAFAAAPVHQRPLRHLVERTLAGEGARLKETAIAIDVFQRPPDRFDPRSDSIVRVEVRRLRERLAQHYAGPEGRAARWRVELPKGGYRPRMVPAPAGGQAQADELVERGQFFLRLGHEDGYRKALARFEQAAQLAPERAAAHAGVARAWMQLVATNIEAPRPGIGLALAAVHRALAIEPHHADSLVMAAQLTHRFEFDWPAARALYARAARAAPSSAYVPHATALSLMLRGELDAADEMLARARALDPLHLAVRAHQGLLALYRRDWDTADATLAAMLDMAPENVLALSLRGAVALYRGDGEAALALYRRVAGLHPRLSIGAAGEVQALAALGREAESRQALDRLRRNWAGHYLSPYQLAMCAERLGDADQALKLMARAVDERDPNALCLPVDPAFDALRERSGAAAALVRRVMGDG